MVPLSNVGTQRISFFGHVTRNTAEGENGCIVDEREWYPLIFAELYMMLLLEKCTDQRTEIEDITGECSDLTTFAKKVFMHEKNLCHQNTGFKIYRHGKSGRYQVWDFQSIDQERHCVDLDPNFPSCNPCDTRNNFWLTCRHNRHW